MRRGGGSNLLIVPMNQCPTSRVHACDDVLMVTCSTGPDTAAYVALALVIVSIAMMRMCTCDWGDDGEESSDDECTDGVRSMFS